VEIFPEAVALSADKLSLYLPRYSVCLTDDRRMDVRLPDHCHHWTIWPPTHIIVRTKLSLSSSPTKLPYRVRSETEALSLKNDDVDCVW